MSGKHVAAKLGAALAIAAGLLAIGGTAAIASAEPVPATAASVHVPPPVRLYPPTSFLFWESSLFGLVECTTTAAGLEVSHPGLRVFCAMTGVGYQIFEEI